MRYGVLFAFALAFRLALALVLRTPDVLALPLLLVTTPVFAGNSVAVCVLRNVRIRLDNTLTLIRVGVVGVGIVRIGCAISVIGSTAARKGYAGDQH